MALGELPSSRVQTVDEVSLEAEEASASYDNALQLLLEDHDYDFAILRQALAAVVNDRPGEWRHAYALPGDMARLSHILPFGLGEVSGYAGYSWYGRMRGGERGVPHRVSGDRLYCNVDGAILEYVSRTPSEDRFSAMFARALALELASRIVMPIKKDSKRQGELLRLAETARERAKANDMNRDAETPRDFIPEAQLAREGWVR